MTVEPVDGIGEATKVDVGWLREHYPMMTSADQLADDYADEFGWRPSTSQLYRAANANGIRKERVGRPDRQRSERRVNWVREPEKAEWMLEHDHGQRTDQLSEEFREAFGFGLTRTQITWFRMRYGTTTKSCRHNTEIPVGSERYDAGTRTTYVKVAENATKRGTKDNWVSKAHLAWAEAHGEPFPDGCCCYHADGDRANLDPGNLVAVPKRLVAQINAMKDQWLGSAEILEMCMAVCSLSIARTDVKMATEVTCEACGKPFKIDEKYRSHTNTPRHCPDCIAKGLHYVGHPRRFDHDEIIRRHENGESTADIARDIGCSYALAWQVVTDRYNRKRK